MKTFYPLMRINFAKFHAEFCKEFFYLLIRIYFARILRTDAGYYIHVSSFAQGCEKDIFISLLVPNTHTKPLVLCLSIFVFVNIVSRAWYVRKYVK